MTRSARLRHVAPVALLLFAAPALHAEAPASALVGTWRSAVAPTPAPDGSTSAYVRQTITFTESRERLLVEAFADADLAQPLFVYESDGPYAVVGPWPAIEGAYAADLSNDRAEVTAFVDAPALWDALNLGACPLEIGVAVDIAACADGPPFAVGDCVDMDVVHVGADGRSLRMGGGEVDRCQERPTTLGDLVFLRQ